MIFTPFFIMIGIGLILNAYYSYWIGIARIFQLFFMIFFAHFLATYYKKNELVKLLYVILIFSTIWFAIEPFLSLEMSYKEIPGISIRFTVLRGIIGEPSFTGIMLAGIGVILLVFKNNWLFVFSIILVLITGNRASLFVILCSLVLVLESKIPDKVWKIGTKVFLIFLLFYPFIFLIFHEFGGSSLKENLFALTSARSAIHSTYIEIFKSHPFGIGYFRGPSLFLQFSNLIASSDMYNSVILKYNYEQHSLFMQVLSEFGIAGYLCFGLFNFNVVNIALNVNKRLAYGYCCLLFGFVMLNGFSEFILYFFIAIILREAIDQKKERLLNKKFVFK